MLPVLSVRKSKLLSSNLAVQAIGAKGTPEVKGGDDTVQLHVDSCTLITIAGRATRALKADERILGVRGGAFGIGQENASRRIPKKMGGHVADKVRHTVGIVDSWSRMIEGRQLQLPAPR